MAGGCKIRRKRFWRGRKQQIRVCLFFHGEKFGPTQPQNPNPIRKTNDNARVEFFQRRNADGFVETKRFHLDGKFQWTDYKLKSGEYVSTLGPLIKMEYVYDDAEEMTNAAKFDHPYEFKLLKSEMIGTNDCIVIARCMTPEFFGRNESHSLQKFQQGTRSGVWRRFQKIHPFGNRLLFPKK
jgi:hypothetical protein